MIDWLKKRLPPVKAAARSWQQLAECIQTFWEENFDPDMDRLKSFLSIYGASADDRALMLRELGGKIHEDAALPGNIPLAFVCRRLELIRKGSEAPLLSAIARAYPAVQCEWKPLYAKIEDPYGTAFYREEEIGAGWSVHLTSRGRVLVHQAFDQSISDTVTRYAQKLVPLHIVFDGVEFTA